MLQQIFDTLASKTDALSRACCNNSPIAYVYNPLIYAAQAHASYIKRFGSTKKDVLLLGMNPGPWGMMQTGIPFGSVPMVRDWLGIVAHVDKPVHEHPKRLVTGYACNRVEVSGQRLWGWAAESFGTPENFFKQFLVLNYCPLGFIEASGKNFTPDKLPANLQKPLLAACDEALGALVDYYQPRYVIGIGGFAHQQAHRALQHVANLHIGQILHPSPASPAANRGWGPQATRALQAQGITL